MSVDSFGRPVRKPLCTPEEYSVFLDQFEKELEKANEKEED